MRKDLKLYDLAAECSRIGRQVGLVLHDKVVRVIARERSNNANSRILARKHNFHLIKSETLLVFRKAEPGIVLK